MEEIEYTRLHITPFNARLLNTIIPPSILPNARNISYHSIVTFPEKGYGYVELPTMDAEKIKKKLNGTTLQGTKVRIEKARPAKEIVIEEEEEQEPERPKKERKTKRKRDELPGVDIGGRRVKRGWTTAAKDVKKDQPVIKSKYTTGPECLFKTNLPPNVASRGKTAEVRADNKKRKPGKAVVHEFAKTTKYATFLRGSGASNSARVVVEFVEGKGWVDEEGNVVEKVRESRKIISIPVENNSKAESPEPDRMELDVAAPVSEKEESSSDSSSSENSGSDSKPDAEVLSDPQTEQQIRAIQDAQLQNTAKGSSSGSSSSSSDSEDENATSSQDSSEDESDQNVGSSPGPLAAQDSRKEYGSSSDDSSDDEPVAEGKAMDADSSSSSDSSDDSASDESDVDSEVDEPKSAVTNKSQASSGPSLSIKIPDSLTSTPIASLVHPLEALYKRPKPTAMDPPKAAESSFSFFGADGDDEDIQAETHLQFPLTPFTQKDFEFRGMRSAAPTPDTAHPNKRFVWPSEKDEEDKEAVASSPIRKGEKSKGKVKEAEKETEPESDFQKWFYENRGDVRRAWTGRKKAAAKEKRQRENRKSQHRAF